MDLLGYKNKRVIVSGCFSGMGEATARLLLEQGAEVHGLDFKETSLKLASFNQVDLRDPATVDAAVARIGGKVDALFNCAGLPQTAPPMDVMRVNFAGTRHVTEQVLPLMSEGAAIASISSNGGLGWSRRMPVIMELISQQGYDAAIKWCEAHLDEVKEGYAFSKEMIIVWTMLTASDQERYPPELHHARADPNADDEPLQAGFRRCGDRCGHAAQRSPLHSGRASPGAAVPQQRCRCVCQRCGTAGRRRLYGRCRHRPG